MGAASYAPKCPEKNSISSAGFRARKGLQMVTSVAKAGDHSPLERTGRFRSVLPGTPVSFENPAGTAPLLLPPELDSPKRILRLTLHRPVRRVRG
jgi:hypothetical protein